MSRPATSRLKVNPALGTLPVLQYCAPDQLQVDPSYQRSLEASQSQTLIRRIAMYWDWGLCQPLVVARRSDGRLYVVDGQHRLSAAKLRGDIWQIPCVIASYATTSEEAAAFVAINQERRPLGALEIFRAAVAAEDEVAIAVVAALADNGLAVAPHLNCGTWKPGMVSNVSAVAAAWRRDGAEKTKLALKIMATAYQGVVLQYCGTVFGGIIGAIRAKPNLDADALARGLRQLGQAGMRVAVMKRRAENPNEKYAMAAANVVLALVGATAPKPVHIAPSGRRAPVIAPPEDADKRWCEQCEKRVSTKSLRFCVSRFCSLRKSA